MLGTDPVKAFDVMQSYSSRALVEDYAYEARNGDKRGELILSDVRPESTERVSRKETKEHYSIPAGIYHSNRMSSSEGGVSHNINWDSVSTVQSETYGRLNSDAQFILKMEGFRYSGSSNMQDGRTRVTWEKR